MCCASHTRSPAGERLVASFGPRQAALVPAPHGRCYALSAVTSHLTVNIAAIPLLWILPLAVYLLTFILAFELPGLYRRSILVRLLVVMLASLGYTLSRTDVSFPIGISILFYLAELFFACCFCHAEAYALRPPRTSETTLFYLLIAGGGAAGTFFIGIASPLIFTANYDMPLSFAVTALLALLVTWRDGWGTAIALDHELHPAALSGLDGAGRIPSQHHLSGA